MIRLAKRLLGEASGGARPNRVLDERAELHGYQPDGLDRIDITSLDEAFGIANGKRRLLPRRRHVVALVTFLRSQCREHNAAIASLLDAGIKGKDRG